MHDPDDVTKCKRCGKELEIICRIVRIAQPDKSESALKYHLCEECYTEMIAEMMKWIATGKWS